MSRKQRQSSKNRSSEISPLDEIRQAEASAASQIVLAQQAAKSAMQAARTQANRILAEAQQAGTTAGQVQYEMQIQDAIREAEQMRAAAQRQSEAIEREGLQHLHEAAQWALNLVLGQTREEHQR